MNLRRHLLCQTASLAGLALCGAAGKAADEGAPPVARRVPVRSDVFGQAVLDEYRWMEDLRDPELLPWMKAQDAHARQVLSRIPGHAALAERVSALSGGLALTSQVAAAGPWLFYEQQPAGAQSFQLLVRAQDRRVRVLVDPAQTGRGGKHLSLDWWVPSNDGRHVAYGLSESGSEASTTQVIEVDSGRVLAERIPDTDSGVTGWLPDGSGFFYLKLTGERGKPTLYQDTQLKLHRLGQDPSRDRIVLQRGQHPQLPMEPLQVPSLYPVRGTDWALVMVADIRPERALWTVRLSSLLAEGRPHFEPVARFEDLVVDVAAAGDDLFLVSNRDAPRGRVLLTSVARPSLSTAVEVHPQGAAVIDGIEPVRGGALARLLDGGVHRLLHLRRGAMPRPVPLPFDGSVRRIFSSGQSDEAYLSLSGWFEPQGIWQLDLRPGDAHRLPTRTDINPGHRLDLSGFVAERRFATARDGTRVPYTILARQGWQTQGPRPVLADAYGAYQFSQMPRFDARLLAFLDAGGVKVVAHVRGGGEYGREWHKGGQKSTKPNTWRDFIDVAQALIDSRVTTASRLVISGTSAGGIAVGRALTERPELFAGAIADVGWMNPIRYEAEQNVSDIDEWGPAVDAESFRILHAMDSYHAVQDGVKYPAVLVMSGYNDPRVATFHATKFAARLQAATASDAPVLLRVDFDAGHGVGSTRQQRDRQMADTYAFVLWRSGAAAAGGGGLPAAAGKR